MGGGGSDSCSDACFVWLELLELKRKEGQNPDIENQIYNLCTLIPALLSVKFVQWLVSCIVVAVTRVRFPDFTKGVGLSFCLAFCFCLLLR